MAENYQNLPCGGCKSKIELNRLENTLSAIALEIQNFAQEEKETVSSLHPNYGDALHKSNLKLKNKQIKKLTGDLKMACDVAKKVLIAKEEETQFLKDQINDANRTIAEKDSSNEKTLEKLKHSLIKNQLLYNQLDKLNNLINLGFMELKKIQGKSTEQVISPLLQLKEIIYSCGQYYADYCNEKIVQKQKEQQFQSKIRFLESKTKILENQLDALGVEVINLRQQNQRLNKDICATANKSKNNNAWLECYSVNEVVKNRSNQQESNGESFNSTRRSKESLKRRLKLDFSCHFSLVKDLLLKQTQMLEGLKEISEEFVSIQSFTSREQ